MFSKLALVATTAFAVLAAARMSRQLFLSSSCGIYADKSGNQCQTSQQQCCQSVQNASSKEAQDTIGNLIDATFPADATVGLTCSPLSVIGSGIGCQE